MTDEVVESEWYGALPLSYGAVVEIAPVGFEPTIPGLVSMYSNSAVGRVLLGAQRRTAGKLCLAARQVISRM